MPKFNVVHITKYVYPYDVTDSVNQIILFPKNGDFQRIISNNITINPKASVATFEDYFGNEVGTFSVIQPHKELEIKVDLTVETFSVPNISTSLALPDQWSMLQSIKSSNTHVDFLQEEHFECRSEIDEVIKQHISNQMNVHDVIFTLSNYIYKNFQYRQGVTTVESTIDEIWELKAGVCQDFAHLLIAMLRILGIPSRYTSGYISPSKSSMRGVGATHAWVEVYIPEVEWRGIDPTNDCWVQDMHIKIAHGRDFRDCTPVKGTYNGPSDNTLTVSVFFSNLDNRSMQTAGMEHDEPAYISVSEDGVVDNTLNTNSYHQHLHDLEQQQQQQQQ